jgi:hypothetical protein
VAADVTGDGGALVPIQPEGSTAAGQPEIVSPGPKPAAEHSRAHALHMPHRSRFVVVYGLLAAALGVAAAGVVVFAGRAIHPAPPWSAWRPHGGGLGAAREIGDHVASSYRLPSGKQLVDVITKAPSVSPASNTSIPIHYVALRGSPKGKVDEIIPISQSDSVMFSLCGLGPACAIATGTASVARGRLVRREILELALYTFRYSGIDNVIAFMPPKTGSQPQYVVYLRRPDLAEQLHVPLVDTLRSKTPLPNTIPAREVNVVDSTTESRLYSFSLSQAQQGDAILVLDPLPA